MKFLPKIDNSLFGLDFGSEYNKQRFYDFLKKNIGKTLVIMTEEEFKKATNGLRSEEQSNAMFLWFSWIEKETENRGITWNQLVGKTHQLKITKQGLHDMWKQLQKALYGTKSTKQLKKTKEIDTIIEHFVDLFGLVGMEVPPFPNDDEKQKEKIAPREKPDIEYPENNLGESKF